MGQELACKLHFGGKVQEGKAYLETEHVLFRGNERLKIQLRELTAVAAENGTLRLEFPGGPAALELGPAADKWAQRILHPPSRLDKLGIRAGTAIAVVGKLEPAFLREIDSLLSGQSADLLFFAAEKTGDLDRVAKLRQRLKPKGALWIVYPKGVDRIREIEVIAAGRAAGLKDTRVVSFSNTHTALRFSTPAR